MTRQYIPLALQITPPSKESIALLAETMLREALEDGSGLLEVFRSLQDYELLDILRSELSVAPRSPISFELRRLMKEHYERKARKVAREILVSE